MVVAVELDQAVDVIGEREHGHSVASHCVDRRRQALLEVETVDDHEVGIRQRATVLHRRLVAM